MGTVQTIDLGTSEEADKLQKKLVAARKLNKTTEKNNTKDDIKLPRSVKGPNGRYTNPFPTYVQYGLADVKKWKSASNPPPLPAEKTLNNVFPVIEPDFSALNKGAPPGKIQVTFIGHATVLVQFDGLTILCDPIFSQQCFPVQFAGPQKAKRIRGPPCKIDKLPNIDIVVISHDHYDHLDYNSVIELSAKRPPPMWFVPMGMKSWMTDSGVLNVVEMDWAEEANIERKNTDFTIICTPCQHWCCRTPFDKHRRLWCSWLIRSPNFSFWFGGDTGYCNVFKTIGQLYGPIDLCAIPIGAYGAPHERWFHKPNHMNPDEAVETHIDLKSVRSMGIHFGTFALTEEPFTEPISFLDQAREKKKYQFKTIFYFGPRRNSCI